jgi:phosphoribosylformimino-5-aminoimidazole carboxamide ribonucleotide (ProFAR) isomerase
MFQIPGPIEKVIIAGGISSLDDLKYIWGFPKAVPQLGSAIWKHKISISDLCNSIINFNSD